jgi:hypothetical protein
MRQAKRDLTSTGTIHTSLGPRHGCPNGSCTTHSHSPSPTLTSQSLAVAISCATGQDRRGFEHCAERVHPREGCYGGSAGQGRGYRQLCQQRSGHSRGERRFHASGGWRGESPASIEPPHARGQGAYINVAGCLAIKMATGFHDSPSLGLPSGTEMMIVLSSRPRWPHGRQARRLQHGVHLPHHDFVTMPPVSHARQDIAQGSADRLDDCFCPCD